MARATYREILERRAMENGVDFVNGLGTALTPMALYEVVMNEAYRRLVDGGVDVSIDAGLRAAEKLQALVDARAGQADMAGVRAEMSRVIDAVKEFVPRARWPELQARLRGEPTAPGEVTSARVPQAAPVRLVPIGDWDEEQ